MRCISSGLPQSMMRIARILILAYLASKSCGLQAVLNRLRASLYSVVIFDQPTVQVRAFLIGIRRFDLCSM